MPSGSGLLIAVVDDDEAVRDSLGFLLEVAGHRVLTYASATEFLQGAPVNELTCLVVDQHMPELTGLQMITSLRSRGVNLPTVLITGSPSADVLRLAQELAVTLVLEKPLDDDRLLRFVADAAG